MTAGVSTPRRSGLPPTSDRWPAGYPGALDRCSRPEDRRPCVGYFTAIMAEVVGAGGSVVACEVDPEPAGRASENLDSYPNVAVHAGDGAAFDPGPCDAMLIIAGVTHPHAPWLAPVARGRPPDPAAHDSHGCGFGQRHCSQDRSRERGLRRPGYYVRGDLLLHQRTRPSDRAPAGKSVLDGSARTPDPAGTARPS